MRGGQEQCEVRQSVRWFLGWVSLMGWGRMAGLRGAEGENERWPAAESPRSQAGSQVQDTGRALDWGDPLP